MSPRLQNTGFIFGLNNLLMLPTGLLYPGA